MDLFLDIAFSLAFQGRVTHRDNQHDDFICCEVVMVVGLRNLRRLIIGICEFSVASTPWLKS